MLGADHSDSVHSPAASPVETARILTRKRPPPGGRSAGVDLLFVSPSRVVLAVSGPDGGALPLGTIKRAARDVRAVSAKIAAAATRHRAALLAVGWPLEPSGVAGERCAAVRAFVDAVRAEAALPPVVFVDERFTTQAARHALGEAGAATAHGAEDAAAAALIVEALLEEERAPPSRFFADDGAPG